MGAKDSKPSFITYDDAVKRVSDSELRRIREAFKRCSGSNGANLSVDAFKHDVLCDGVPSEVADWLYQACGGTRRGIPFKELLCGLVVLTKGDVEEKIKFLWTLYCNDSGTHIYKWDFIKALQVENLSLPTVTQTRTAEILTGLFGSQSEKVGFEQFRSWMLIHKDATILSKWLLIDPCVNLTTDLETPTFYQSLAGVTHLEERDIIELEKCFWILRGKAESGQLDVETLLSLLSPPLPRSAVRGAFLAFDENRDGHVDFKELCCGLSAACRGPTIERLKFCFKIFDTDRDGYLNRVELAHMVNILCFVANEDKLPASPYEPDVILEMLQNKAASSPSVSRNNSGRTIDTKPLFRIDSASRVSKDTDASSECDQNGDGSVVTNGTNSPESMTDFDDEPVLSQEDFLIWSVESAEALLSPFLQLIFEVCHIALGLRPQCKHQERDIVLGCLERHERRGYAIGQFWYLVSADWWSAWLAHTAPAPGGDGPPATPTAAPGGDGPLAAPPVPRAPPAARRCDCTRSLSRDAKTIDEAVVCDESFTSNSTESMGSLLGRAETASIASVASSSGVSSGASGATNAAVAPHSTSVRHPGCIDNRHLIWSPMGGSHSAVHTLTGEGGRLRRDVTLAQHRDFELVPDALWKALSTWYGGPQPLPRQVIRPPNSDVELELYPLNLRLYRHIPSTPQNAPPSSTWSGMVGGYGAAALSSVGVGSSGYSHQSIHSSTSNRPPDRHLAYTAAFSRLATVKQVCDFLCGTLGLAREDVRLWQIGSDVGSLGATILLDDESPSLRELCFEDGQALLIEVRNRDLTWPEEIGALSLASGVSSPSGLSERRGTLGQPTPPGATGLHNLGNTCFMNAALQAVWNTGALTQYFNSGTHLFELNTENPLGTKGALAQRYGELCKEVWHTSVRSVAPLRVRWCVQRYAAALGGGGQHDAQEMLAWLLDALHEDLNRCKGRNKPCPPLHDSDGRPDEIVASEAWEQYSARNSSVITDLFYGQLKSKVRCMTCGHESVRFDTFNMLSLPLPMENYVHAEVRVMRLDGSVPVRYGLRLNSENRNAELKRRLAQMCRLPATALLLVELDGSRIARVLDDSARVRPHGAAELFAYELPGADDDADDDRDVEADDSPVLNGHANPEYETTVSSTTSVHMLMRPESGHSEESPETNILKSDNSSNSKKEDIANRKHPLNSYGSIADKPTRSSPTLSIKSLNAATGDSPRLKKKKFGSSPSNMDRYNVTDGLPTADATEMRTISSRPHYLVAVHRKQCRQDSYFLSQHKSKPALFGIPLLIPLKEAMTSRELYTLVWNQVTRLLSAQPQTPPDQSNHATDCDDSLGYTFPFTLSALRTSGTSNSANGTGGNCALCPWPRFCRGCVLPCSDEPFVVNLWNNGRSQKGGTSSMSNSMMNGITTQPSSIGSSSTNSPIPKAKHSRLYFARDSWDDDSQMPPERAGSEIKTLDFRELRHLVRNGSCIMNDGSVVDLMLAIDWDPTALHLRYQSTREKAWLEHSSVAFEAGARTRPVQLDHCLAAFTAEERLEQRYHCQRCRAAQPATKKLQIWKLPPILIVHLKRFQYVNNKWIKSQKVVNFPYADFEPTSYLASVPQETILRHQELFNFRRRIMQTCITARISESELSDEEEESEEVKPAREQRRLSQESVTTATSETMRNRKRVPSMTIVRERLESTSLTTTPIIDDNLIDYHKHKLVEGEDPFDLKYQLYAVVSHSGQMSGGHYVAYARNPNGHWYCYNDSSCRELPAGETPPIDPASAYLLFYERRGLASQAYLPDVDGRVPLACEVDPDAEESDLKKMCVLC